jgi:hypothetical protein
LNLENFDLQRTLAYRHAVTTVGAVG